MKEIIQIDPKDNVIVALKPLKKGTVILNDVELKEDVDFGHKVAIKDINIGEQIIKYGTLIGYAKEDIKKGDHVHTHNIKTSLGAIEEYEYKPIDHKEIEFEDDFFYGFKRNNGKVGVRNEIWIIPTVGCVNTVVKKIEELSRPFKQGNIDEIVAFNHPYGCSQMSEDQENTRKILADLILHPNAGAVLVVGLGCENSNIDELKKYLGTYDPNRIRFMVSQEEENEVDKGVEIVKELIEVVKDDTREKVSMEHLIVGLKCGGSDGLSGISANPTVGRFSDLLISKKGTTILTEVPEMFGAEQSLMNRCIDNKTFEKTVSLINDFKKYFSDNHQTIYENPSPGNKKGGISTLEDKSNGCVQKSGTSQVIDVLKYGDTANKKGLLLLSAPGNDLVASTALAAAGAQIVLFTTGRGTPFASPVPTVKISSNSTIATHKNNWIDFNAGKLVDEDNISLNDLGKELYDYVKEVAEGRKTKAEIDGYHDLAIFKNGVTL